MIMADYIFIIAILSVLSLCFEHPFDVMKTWWQAYPRLSSMRMVAGKIYVLKGFYGFYSGFFPNMVRILSKQIYRYPLMILLPVFYKNIAGDFWFISVLCALTIAFFEILVITPLEHLKVRFILMFYKQNLTCGLYQGAPIVAIRQIVSWLSFLCAQDFFSYAFPHANLILLGLMVGVVNTLCTLPFDCMKTHIQSGKTSTMLEAYTHIRTQNGFYKGITPRLIQYTINAIFTLLVLSRFKQ